VFAFAPDDLLFFLRVFDGVDGGEIFLDDVYSGYGGGQEGAVGVGEEEDWLFGVVDVGDGEAGVVFGEVDDGVFAGDVGGRDDGELLPGNGGVEIDGGDAAARDGAANGGAEPHSREGDVVDVLSLAQDLGFALFAWGGLTDDGRSSSHESG
jgi:hypothetical protein